MFYYCCELFFGRSYNRNTFYCDTFITGLFLNIQNLFFKMYISRMSQNIKQVFIGNYMSRPCQRWQSWMRGELTSSSIMWQLSMLVQYGPVAQWQSKKHSLEFELSLSLTRSVVFPIGRSGHSADNTMSLTYNSFITWVNSVNQWLLYDCISCEFVFNSVSVSAFSVFLVEILLLVQTMGRIQFVCILKRFLYLELVAVFLLQIYKAYFGGQQALFIIVIVFRFSCCCKKFY